MKKNGESRKNKAGAAAGVKPDAAKAKAAKVAADKGKKRSKDKPQRFKFTVGGEVYTVSENATVAELLRGVIVGVVKLSEQVESVRRTLWRMSEVRDYKGAGDKPEAAKESAK